MNVKRVRFYDSNKEVRYWTHEKKMGTLLDGSKDMKSWSCTASYLDYTFDLEEGKSVEDILKKHLDDFCLPNDYICILDDGLISFNCIEDGMANCAQTIEEEKQLEKNGEQLFNCDYYLKVEILDSYEPSAEEMIKLFPNSQKAF